MPMSDTWYLEKDNNGTSINFIYMYAQKEIGRARANISESNEVETGMARAFSQYARPLRSKASAIWVASSPSTSWKSKGKAERCNP